MARVRPLADLPKAIANMALSSGQLPQSVVKPLAENVRAAVEQQSRRYYIKGRNGKRVNLTAKVRNGKGTTRNRAERVVYGSPAGATSIVNAGSSPHLITGTKLRTTRKGKTVRVGAAARLRQFGEGESIDGKPLRIPGIGFRQYAQHPGHRAIGQPWKKAMIRSDEIVFRTLESHARQALTQGWRK